MNILQSSFRYGVLFFTLALATAGAGDPLVKIDSRVECPAGLIDKVKEEARKQRPEEIRKIWIGELNHPGRSFGARLEYAPECYGTYAIVRTFSAQIPGEPTTEYLPELKMERYGFRLIRIVDPSSRKGRSCKGSTAFSTDGGGNAHYLTGGCKFKSAGYGIMIHEAGR